MFFLSKELQCQSVNWKHVQYEVERTCESVSVIDDDQIQAKVNEYCNKIGGPLELTLTMPIHQTRSTSSNSAAYSINNQIFNLKSYMKNMIEEEFRIRFDSKNIIPCYLDIDTLGYLVAHFDCLDINRSVLKLALSRAKIDLRLGLPISKKRCANLIKLINLKNAIATSTATAERSFSAMNRVCSELRSKPTLSRLGDLLCIALNKDLVPELDINGLINSWASTGE